MKFWKIFFYILLVPVFLYIVLFFEYLSFFNVFLIFSVFCFRDLDKKNWMWFLILVSVLLDISLSYWLGTTLLGIVFALLVLLVFDRFVGNTFLDFISVFFTFILFRLFAYTFIFFQETSTLLDFNLELFVHVVIFAVKNMGLYLLVKLGEYFLSSYFRENV